MSKNAEKKIKKVDLNINDILTSKENILFDATKDNYYTAFGSRESSIAISQVSKFVLKIK
jgi:hypothetical protein